MKVSLLLLLFLLTTSLFLIFGCTQETLTPPFSFNQYARYIHEKDGGDFNLTAYYAGDYNSLCLARVDWNVLQMFDCNSVGGGVGDVNWSDITGLPLSCPVGQAIQVLDDTLTCVSVGGTDTNWVTGWSVFDANMKAQYRKYTVDLNTTENISSDKSIFATSSASNILVGTKASVSTATPNYLSLGGTYANTVTSSKAKFKFYDDGTAINNYAIGISSNQFNFFTTGVANYVWYFADVEKARLTATGNFQLATDNQKFLVGTAQDASMYYDGTNLIVNPKEVGTGVLNVKGTVAVDNNVTISGHGYITDDGTYTIIGRN